MFFFLFFFKWGFWNSSGRDVTKSSQPPNQAQETLQSHAWPQTHSGAVHGGHCSDFSTGCWSELPILVVPPRPNIYEPRNPPGTCRLGCENANVSWFSGSSFMLWIFYKPACWLGYERHKEVKQPTSFTASFFRQTQCSLKASTPDVKVGLAEGLKSQNHNEDLKLTAQRSKICPKRAGRHHDRCQPAATSIFLLWTDREEVNCWPIPWSMWWRLFLVMLWELGSNPLPWNSSKIKKGMA